jgi:hypothetical protein
VIRYELDDAHRYYRRCIPALIEGLMEKYPYAPLRVVKLYEAKPDDHSMGNVNVPGIIALNPYWFTAAPERLQSAATDKLCMTLGNGVSLAYHGLMTGEPSHLITHEMCHIMQAVWPYWQPKSRAAWRQATHNPELSPAGYAFTNEVEFCAELFAAYELGVATAQQAELMRDIMS